MGCISLLFHTKKFPNLLDVNQFHLLVSTSPAFENTLSQGIEYAGMQRVRSIIL